MSNDNTSTAARERRIIRRRALKKGVTLTVRKGMMGLGPNLALGGVELSHDGIQLKVKCELTKGDEIEIGLTGVGRSKAMTLMAEVRWCRAADEDGEAFIIGARFRKRLPYAELGQFV